MTEAYRQAEDALYEHERPYYRYCASGFPMHFCDPNFRREWDRKRLVLEAAVERLRPETEGDRHIRMNRNPKLQAVSDGR